MNGRPRVRRTGAVLVLALASCRTITVEPEGRGLPELPAAQRPALDFELHVTDDLRLGLPGFDTFAEVVDGEDLADRIAPFREALEATNVFSAVTRAQAGRRLHCDLSVRMCRVVEMGGFFLTISAGLLPDMEHSYYEIVASVSAPGRSPQTYTVRGHGKTFLWTPLIPIGLVQLLVQSGTLQQTMDSLVARMAAYGWLQL